MIRSLAVLLLSASLAACGTVFQRASDTVTVRSLLRVNTAGSEPWNRFTPDGSKHREIWTRHGLPLDTLTFFVAVKDGEPLDDLAETSDKAPRFRAPERRGRGRADRNHAGRPWWSLRTGKTRTCTFCRT